MFYAEDEAMKRTRRYMSPGRGPDHDPFEPTIVSSGHFVNAASFSVIELLLQSLRRVIT